MYVKFNLKYVRDSTNPQEPQVSENALAPAAGFESHLHKNLQSL